LLVDRAERRALLITALTGALWIGLLIAGFAHQGFWVAAAVVAGAWLVWGAWRL
jgi:hypothetical protein